MNKNTILTVLIVGVVYYYYHQSKKKAMATELAQYIIASGKHKGPIDMLSKFGVDYLKPWYAAIQAGQNEFIYKGVRYQTQGGKVVR